MIKGYKDFYYNVKDMKKAVSFYEQAFGMKNVRGDEYWTTLQLGNLNLGLHWTEGSDIPTTPRDDHGQECGGTLTLDSDNIADDKIAVLKCGGKVLGESDQPWGHMLVIEDLDGNVLKLMKAKY